MQPLSEILSWKLLSGSHEHPGPDGGTCINEAAIVVAGFPYKPVESVDDLPPCFSHVISAYLIKINDDMNDTARQRLIEFVPLLSGSADTLDIEDERLAYITVETVRRILSMTMDAAGLYHLAAACRSVTTAAAARENAMTAEKIAVKLACYAAVFAAGSAAEYDLATAAYTADCAQGVCAHDLAETAEVAKKIADISAIDDHCIEIVRGALAIGRRADPINTEIILQRAAKAKATIAGEY